jgi:hypothetical protein
MGVHLTPNGTYLTGNLAYFLNDQTGEFLAPQNITDAAGIVDIAFYDFDGNGYQDLLYTDSYGEVRLVSNNGLVFNVVQSWSLPSQPKFWDINNDGRLDIVYTEEIGSTTEVQVLESSTGFVFNMATSIALLNETGIYLTDFADEDNNGEKDLYYTSPSGVNCLNSVSGVFNSQLLISVPNGFEFIKVKSYDFNQDNQTDLVLSSYSTSQGYVKEIYEQTGASTYAYVTSLTQAQNVNFVILDYNNDGLDDIVFSESYYENLPGNGISFKYKLRDAGGENAVIYDFSNDGVNDVININTQQQRINLFENISGGGYMMSHWEYQCTSASDLKVFAGNYNGDTLMDIFIYGDPANGNNDIYVLEGQANQQYAPGVSILTSTAYKQLVDYNGDGVMDVIAFDPNNYNLNLHLNDGLGNLNLNSSAGVLADFIQEDFQIVDLNGDQILDVVGRHQNNYDLMYCMGGANNQFSSATILNTGVQTSGLRVFDYNLDGHKDMVYWGNPSAMNNYAFIHAITTSGQALQFNLNPVVVDAWTNSTVIQDLDYDYYTNDNLKDFIAHTTTIVGDINEIICYEQNANGFNSSVVMLDFLNINDEDYFDVHGLQYGDLDGDGDADLIWRHLAYGTGLMSTQNDAPGPLVGMENFNHAMSGNGQLHVAPNPFDVATQISLVGYGDEKMEVKLFDASGRMIKTYSFNASEELTLANEGWSKGVYFIQVQKEQSKQVIARQRIVLQ